MILLKDSGGLILFMLEIEIIKFKDIWCT